MKKSILEKLGNHKNLLPVAVGFLLAPSFVYAQNAEQVKKIRQASDLGQLNTLQKAFGKSTLTVKQLQSQAKKLNIPFSGETSKGKLYQLQGFDKKGQPLYYVTNNTGAAEGTGTNKVGAGTVFNLEGVGMKVHEWDGGGVKITHQEFGGRVSQKDTPTGFSAHATHVAGTMIAGGVNPAAKGMAPKATLDAYDWNSDEQEMTAAAAQGAILSNHSYGYLGAFEWGDWSGNQGWHWFGAEDETEYVGYGFYSDADRDWDLIAKNAPYYLPVKAAGNPRGDGPEPGGLHYVRDEKGVWHESTVVRQKNGGADGFDCIGTGSVGKNILTVGAVAKIPGGYTQPSDVKMASFSGFGPVNDGRIKPDLSGIGVGLTSTVSSDDAAYSGMSGTSMASPNVTGSLLLIQEQYSKSNNGDVMRAATLKALAIGTANEVGVSDGPDYASGWGLLNTYDAVKAIAFNGKYTLIQEKTLRNNQESRLDVVASGVEPLKVTIAWTDPVPSTLSDDSVVNDRTKMLVNDLDLRVLKNGVEEMPWVLDPTNPGAAATKGDNTVDNVEQVVINNPEAGATYTIVVSHKGDLRDNVIQTNANGDLAIGLAPSNVQDFSLVVIGINNGVQKDLALNSIKSDVAPVDYTSATPVKFIIQNKGTDSIAGAKLAYKFTNKDTGVLVSEGEINIPTIDAGAVVEVSKTFDLSQSFINFSVSGEIVYPEDQVDLNNQSSLDLFGIVADLTPDQASHSFGFEDDFAKNGWLSEDKDRDGRTWRKYDDLSFAHEGKSFAVNFPGNERDINDWLFSNPIKLKGGVLYRVVFFIRKFQNLEESISVALGSEPNSAAMTTEIAAKVEAVSDGAYIKHSYEFSVPNDQVAYVGFNHKTEADATSYAVAIDDVAFQYAEAKPEADFTASKVKANSFETVSFRNTTLTASTLPINSWQWSFEPNTVTYQDSTTATSEEPKVVFNQEGTYSVTLKAVNAKGEGSVTKTDYITIANTAAAASFNVSSENIYVGEAVVFTNTSTGDPEPESFKWTITPSDGVEFVGGTDNTSKNPNVKFNKTGQYSVALEVTSLLNSDEVTKTDLITVAEVHNPVDGLTSNFNTSDQALTLKWDRPVMNPLYQERFEANGNMPADITAVDANNDGINWFISEVTKNSGKYGAISYSWFYGGFDVDDFLISSKIRGGAEVLKYFYKFPYAERYDVYVVEAPASGDVPTVDEIKAGHKVYSFEATGAQKTFAENTINIKDVAQNDFYIAFNHKTTAADDGLYLAIDDIEVGYDNSAAGRTGAKKDEVLTTEQSQGVDFKTEFKKAERLVSNEGLEKASSRSVANPKKTFGALNLPHLTGYKVVKDGVVMENIDDITKRIYDENINANGTYTYGVSAVYSDGVESEMKTIVVDITTLATTDVNANAGLKVYPNPSTGKFVVEADASVSTLKAGVYDMSGKQILSNTFKGNKFELNLTQHPKGVYILNLVDNQGVKHNVKLIVK